MIGAKLITRSALTYINKLQIELLTNTDAHTIVDFMARFPIQPCNPGQEAMLYLPATNLKSAKMTSGLVGRLVCIALRNG